MMNNLNAGQLEAVNSKSKKILCLAGAGTGKTHTMIERISRIASEENPESILALTFTNAAAFEMKERYIKRNPGKRVPEFRTFHGFCYSVICRNSSVRTKLGYSTIPSICTEAQVKQIETRARLELNIKLSSNKLSGKTPVTDPREVFQLNNFKKRVNQIMKTEGVMTFDQLCYDVCKLFVDNEDCIKNIKSMIHFIFVDEFQDTDPRQWEFVKSFDDAELFIVGDALQALYAFRGADSSIIKSLSADKSFQVIKLTENYRSGKEIVSFANKQSVYADDRYRVKMVHVREGGSVSIYQSTAIMYSDIIGQDNMMQIVSQLENHKTEGTSAILCRTNKEVDAVKDYLTSHLISFRETNSDDMYEKVLRSVKDSEFMIDWLSTLLPSEIYAKYLRATIGSDVDPYVVFVSNFLVTFEVRKYFELIRKVRNVFFEKISKKVMAEKILRIFKCNSALCKDITDDIDSSSLIDVILETIRKKDDSEVYVGTIHSSKGLEYNNVFLMNVDGYYFRLTNEDNLNLYYVGITRARDNLVIFKSED